MKGILVHEEHGYILPELLIGIAILSITLTIGVSSLVHFHSGPSPLDQETELLAWHIRRLQMASLYGYVNTQVEAPDRYLPTHPILTITATQYWTVNYRPGYGDAFPDYLQGPDTHKLEFNRLGKPTMSHPILLRDKRTGQANQIVLAAMTGRVRWITYPDVVHK